jgi:hypothetical protein
VTHLAAGQTQISRFFYPSTAPLAWGLSYNDISDALSAGLLGIVALALACFSRLGRKIERYAPYLALAIFGFMMFKTGMLQRYFIYAFPLIVLTWRSMAKPTFITMFSVLTGIIFVGIFGSFVLESNTTPWAAPSFHEGGLPAYMESLFLSDWFITAATAANIWIMVVLGWSAFRMLFQPPSLHSASQPVISSNAPAPNYGTP